MASLLDANTSVRQGKETYIQARKDENDACDAIANAGVKLVSESPEQLLGLLDKMAQFPNFTHRNCLILMQKMPDATHVQTEDDWKRQKRRVDPAQRGNCVMLRKPNSRGYADATRYYDVSQTSGPGKPIKENITLPEGGDEMQAAFVGLVKNTPVEVQEADIDRPALYDPQRRVIYINDSYSDYEAFAAMVQASADVALHFDDIEKNDGRDRGYSPEDMEFMTSCVAYTVCQRYGVPCASVDVQPLHDLLDGLESDDPETTGKERNKVLHMVYAAANICGEAVRQEVQRWQREHTPARPFGQGR